MLKRVIAPLAMYFMLANSACIYQSITPAGASAPEATLVPTTEFRHSTGVQDATCDADDWNIVPISVTEEAHAETPGLKRVVVQFAVENASPYPGKLEVGFTRTDYTTSPMPTLTTEGGFIYPAQSGTWQGHTAEQTFRTIIYVPPGLAVSSTSESERLLLMFDVAESQKKMVVSFPSVTVACVNGIGAGLPIAETVSKTVPLTPTTSYSRFASKHHDGLPDISNQISISDVGTLEFLDFVREDASPDTDTVRLKFKLKNVSSGYRVGGQLFGYLIDNLGLVHAIKGGSAAFDVGPGRAGDVVAEFVVSKQSEQFAFSLERVDKDDILAAPIGVYQAFKISDQPQAQRAKLDGARP